MKIKDWLTFCLASKSADVKKKRERSRFTQKRLKKPQIILKVKNMISHSDLQVDSNLDLILVSF